MERINSIGIMDYGIGGLGLYKLLRQQGFHGNIHYVSDSGAVPYGKQTQTQLAERVSWVLEFFSHIGIHRIAVACNAASTVLNDIAKTEYQLKNIIDSANDAVTRENINNLAIFAGTLTVQSGIYIKLLKSSGIAVTQINTQQLSIHIEAGDIESEELQNLVEESCSSILYADALLLACTHYPAIMNLFRKFVHKEIRIIDPAEYLSAQILNDWNEVSEQKKDFFYTSGNEAKMKYASAKAYDVQIDDIKKIHL